VEEMLSVEYARFQTAVWVPEGAAHLSLPPTKEIIKQILTSFRRSFHNEKRVRSSKKTQQS
jgi:hypothetical protein